MNMSRILRNRKWALTSARNLFFIKVVSTLSMEQKGNFCDCIKNICIPHTFSWGGGRFRYSLILLGVPLISKLSLYFFGTCTAQCIFFTCVNTSVSILWTGMKTLCQVLLDKRNIHFPLQGHLKIPNLHVKVYVQVFGTKQGFINKQHCK
jgi:hypothetical protein